MFRHVRGWLAAFLCFAFFVGLAVLPQALHPNGKPPWVSAAQAAAPVDLATTPASLPALTLSPVASPVRPGDPPASPPVNFGEVFNATTNTRIDMAGLVAGEDQRLRTLLHHSTRILTPAVVPTAGALPTLVLPLRPNAYTLNDLRAVGAVVPTSQPGVMMLVDSVLVGSGAKLTLGGQGLSKLLMSSSTQGFTSLVTWGGTMTLAGDSADSPFTIMGWDQGRGQPAQNHGYGRPYIRAIGGGLNLTNVRASNLGFWSGRTGGVAWTGVNRRPSSGSAVSSTFTGDTYGAFVSRASGVVFKNDLFESNELDGVRLHRGALNVKVTGSAAARNGANGFDISRGATGDVLSGDLAMHNAGNGYLINGQPLVSGASPSGDQTTASVGTMVDGSTADANLRSGILIEGGDGTVIKSSVVRSDVTTAIAVRAGATNTLLSGNDVQSGGRVALSIGPAVTGTTVTGNTLLQARIGILVRNSPGVRLIGNHIGGMSVFGISVRGTSPGVVGNDNVIAGRGFQPIDVRAGAPAPVLRTTDVKGWLHRSQLTALGYLRYHPLLASWLIILTLVTLCIVATRLRRRPAMPYEHTTAWDAHEETMRTLVSGLATPSRAAEPAGQPAGNAAFANRGSLRTQLAYDLAGLVQDIGNPEA
jgi:hypothetical protein